MALTVYKTLSSPDSLTFDKLLNQAVQEGWQKADPIVFNAQGIHVCLAATVERVGLPMPANVAGIEAHAAAIYLERFSRLTQLDSRRSAVPKVLPQGALRANVRTTEDGRFDYAGDTFDLVRCLFSDLRTELAIIRRQGHEPAQFNEFSFYQS